MKNIIFDAESIRAIRDGRKTQTRRVVKIEASGRVRLPGSYKNWHLDDPNAVLACPYGRVGDLVWVREGMRWGEETWIYASDGAVVHYDKSIEHVAMSWSFHKDGTSCSPIHMPRWASRLTLELTDVRVQRVQEISEEDAKAEGSFLTTCGCGSVPKSVVGASFRLTWCQTHGEVFPNRWDAINAKRGYPWVSNPWVWAMTFTPIWKNIDQVLAEREAVA